MCGALNERPNEETEMGVCELVFVLCSSGRRSGQLARGGGLELSELHVGLFRFKASDEQGTFQEG